MFCMNCGAKLPDGAKFCGNCGCKLGTVAEVSTPEENVVQPQVVQSEPRLSHFEKLQRAAESGNAMAQVNLADALMNGRGCEKNEAMALEWYRRAAEQGDTDAQTALNLYEQQQKNLAEEQAKAEWDNALNDFANTLDQSVQEMEKAGALMFFMMESNNVHVKDCVEYELLNNAINAYAFGVDPDDIEILVDDTILMTSGTLGFVVTSTSIVTSRKISVDFCDMDSIAVNGFDIDVTYRDGTVCTIYTLDILTKEERENLNSYLSAVVALSKIS